MSDSTKNFIPLGSVKTYKEGFLRLQGWMTFSALAFFTAGIVVMYEVCQHGNITSRCSSRGRKAIMQHEHTVRHNAPSASALLFERICSATAVMTSSSVTAVMLHGEHVARYHPAVLLSLCLQLLVINVEDQDFRDMLFDYRITRGGVKWVGTNFAKVLANAFCWEGYAATRYWLVPPGCVELGHMALNQVGACSSAVLSPHSLKCRASMLHLHPCTQPHSVQAAFPCECVLQLPAQTVCQWAHVLSHGPNSVRTHKL